MMTFTCQNHRELWKTMENSGRSVDGIVKSHGVSGAHESHERSEDGSLRHQSHRHDFGQGGLRGITVDDMDDFKEGISNR